MIGLANVCRYNYYKLYILIMMDMHPGEEERTIIIERSK